MSELRPIDDEHAGTYWQAAREHRLEIVRCQQCGWWIHYPRPMCPRCLTEDVTPEEVAGTGSVASLAVTHRPPVPTPADELPVVHVLVELDEQPGLRIAASMVDGQRPEIGARVEVVFDDRDGFTLPRFRLVSTSP